LIFNQAFEGPDLYGESSFFETMPSRPSLQTALNISAPSPSVLRLPRIVMAVTANRLQINKLANVKGREIEMMIVVIISMIVVAVLYFAWDEISAARADRKERERWGITWIDYH
jgi:hypothetical protein